MKHGFTLIELLFVLGILAILAAFTIPSIKGVQDESQLAKIQTDLAALQFATEAYYNRYSMLPAETDYQKELLAKTNILSGYLTDPLTKTEYVFRQSGRYYVFLSPGLDRKISAKFDFDSGFFSDLEDDLIATNLKDNAVYNLKEK